MLDLNFLSETLLLAVKKQEEYDLLIDELSKCETANLESLKSDDQKIAFWINIYNAFYQILAKEYPNIGKSIYTIKETNIGGRYFSLDDIEHGILRLGKYKYSLGYWQSFLKYRSVKKFRPSKLDFRIHFALNCGAKSCPPIAFYSADKLSSELNLSTLSFIESETVIDKEGKVLTVSKLFLWFRKDFGGRKGIDKLFNNYLNVETKNYKIEYSTYDWSQALHNFQ